MKQKQPSAILYIGEVLKCWKIKKRKKNISIPDVASQNIILTLVKHPQLSSFMATTSSPVLWQMKHNPTKLHGHIIHSSFEEMKLQNETKE